MTATAPSADDGKAKKSTLTGIKNDSLEKVFIVGMPGSGKTFWGCMLNKKLKLPAYDLDTLIEGITEKSIVEIFAEDGEEYFRKAETNMLHLFAEKNQFILSTGGGTPCYNNNMQWMNKNGITIWINEPIEVLHQRLITEKEQRPLMQNMDDSSLKTYLQQKLEERQHFYELATYKITGNNISETNFTEIIKRHA